MPTYEYVCSKCKHHFEKFQRMTEKALKVCPQDLCPRRTWGRGAVKRVMGAGAGLIFKGSEGYKASAKKESGAATGGSTDTAKKETKSSDTKGEKPSGSSPPASTGSKPA